MRRTRLRICTIAMTIHGTRKITPRVMIKPDTKLEIAGSSSLISELSCVTYSDELMVMLPVFGEGCKESVEDVSVSITTLSGSSILTS